jgi:hypothetical protein
MAEEPWRQDVLVVHQAAGALPLLLIGLADLRRKGALGVRVLAPDERNGEALRVVSVVVSIAPLHTQTFLVHAAGTAVRVHDAVRVFVHVVRERAAHPAVRAHRVHLLQLRARLRGRGHQVVNELDEGKGSRRAHLLALTARHAGADAHRVVEIEPDAGRVSLAGASDDRVYLYVIAGANASVTQNAGLVIHPDDGRGLVDGAAGSRGNTRDRRGAIAVPGSRWPFRPVFRRQSQQLVTLCLRSGFGIRRIVRKKKLGESLPAGVDLLVAGGHGHAVRGLAHARRRQLLLAHIHQAHAADAHRRKAGIVAQDRDLDAGRSSRIPDRGARRDFDLATVDRETDGGRPGALLAHDSRLAITPSLRFGPLALPPASTWPRKAAG